MERLTKRDQKGRAYFDDDGALIRGANGTFHQKKDMTAQFIHQRFVALDKTIDLLAAYEDTGLTPEDMDALRKREQGLAELLASISCGCAVTYTRLRELAQAEKEGRISILVPNDPLTLEELLEMDGEPVWVVRPGAVSRWYLVDVSWKSKNVIYICAAHGPVLFAKAALANGAKIYRRKPEGKEHE